MSPLFNSCRVLPGMEALLPALRQLQEQNVPIVLLPQGQSQMMFMPPKGTKRLPGCDHQPPARGHGENRDFTCPAFMVSNPRLDSHGGAFEKVLERLKSEGIEPAAVFIDFESGVFLRNGAEKKERLTTAMEEAWKCPRCQSKFGKEAMDTPAEYRALCDRMRAEATRRTFNQPVENVFPGAKTGNFFAWPIERYLAADGFVPASVADVAEDSYPAYGYKDSGMSVAQPRAYVVPGWRGWA